MLDYVSDIYTVINNLFFQLLELSHGQCPKTIIVRAEWQYFQL